MIFMRIGVAIVLINLTFIAHAFDYRKCARALNRNSYFLAPSITVGFTSSTGGCSALASRSEEKRRFFAVNYEKFQNEAAKGSGEYLYTFGLLSNCSEIEQMKLNTILKQSYNTIFTPVYSEQSFREIQSLAWRICIRS